jgi:hypothetical protein
MTEEAEHNVENELGAAAATDGYCDGWEEDREDDDYEV